MLHHPNAGPADCHVLTPAQQQVVDLIAENATVTAAAGSVSVHRNTIANWRRRSPSFHAAVANALNERALLRREQIEALLPAALENLRATLADPETPAGVRLKASLAILDRAAAPLPPDVIESAKTHVMMSPEPKPVHNMHNPESPQPSNIHVITSPEPDPVPKLHNSAQPEPKNERSNPIPALHPEPHTKIVGTKPISIPPKVGRNQPCPCGSGRKYKKCCLP